jgi:hypothetical protein
LGFATVTQRIFGMIPMRKNKIDFTRGDTTVTQYRRIGVGGGATVITQYRFDCTGNATQRR